MTSTLLLRIEAPMQSWGVAGASWEWHPSMSRPTKSGVLGLLANMLGRDYADDVSDLAALRFAVRADRPGHIEREYRTAGGGTFALTARAVQENPVLLDDPDAAFYGAPREPVAVNSWFVAPMNREKRGTLQMFDEVIVDAGFIVSLTGDESLLREIIEAIKRPARFPYLGRKAFPLTCSLYLDLLGGDQHETWATNVPLLERATTARPALYIETDGVPNSREQPLGNRSYTHLCIQTQFVSVAAVAPSMP